jgi:hypothetical protein
LRFFLRSVGALLLCCAVAALSYDGARMLANGGLALSSLKQLWLALAPEHFTAAEANWPAQYPYLWTAVITPLLLFPAWISFGALGAFIFLLGYRPKPPEIVADI